MCYEGNHSLKALRMLTWIISGLQAINNPQAIVIVGLFVVASYYLVSAKFHYHSNSPTYRGVWNKNGPIDIVTSVVWALASILLILSLIDLVSRNELTLGFLLGYYTLFIFLFAIVYNVLEWHFPGGIAEQKAGWAGELQSVILSIQIMTSADYTSAKPARWDTESIASLQSLLAIFFIAVFIAKAVARMADPSAGGAITP